MGILFQRYRRYRQAKKSPRIISRAITLELEDLKSLRPWNEYLMRHPEDPVVDKSYYWGLVNYFPQNIKLTQKDYDDLTAVNTANIKQIVQNIGTAEQK